MDQVDQHMLTDQPSGLLSADEAAALLGVKLPTLYAYVSRGLVRSGPAERGRARRYRRADLERLRARKGARRRRGAEAARALHWGEPVLESSITELTADGPVYRGHSALALAAADTAFESVAELLWTGAVSDAPARWTVDAFGLPVARASAVLPRGSPPVTSLSLLVAALAARDPARFDARTDALLPRARALIRRMSPHRERRNEQ